MESIDAYAPPKATVADVDEVPRIPTLFKVLLILFIALDLLGHVIARDFSGLVWLGVMAIAAWQTLKGNRAASRALGVLLVIGTIVLVWGALYNFGRGHALDGGINLGVAVYTAVLIAYLFLHPTMQAVFRRADSKKWSGG